VARRASARGVNPAGWSWREQESVERLQRPGLPSAAVERVFATRSFAGPISLGFNTHQRNRSGHVELAEPGGLQDSFGQGKFPSSLGHGAGLRRRTGSFVLQGRKAGLSQGTIESKALSRALVGLQAGVGGRSGEGGGLSAGAIRPHTLRIGPYPGACRGLGPLWPCAVGRARAQAPGSRSPTGKLRIPPLAGVRRPGRANPALARPSGRPARRSTRSSRTRRDEGEDGGGRQIFVYPTTQHPAERRPRRRLIKSPALWCSPR